MVEVLEHEIDRLRASFWSERDPNGKAFAPLADAYRRKGDLPRALDIVLEGVGRLPEFSSGHVVAGWVHRDMGSAVEAEEAFRRVLELDPENTVALRAMGDLARDRGGHAEAAEYFRRLATLDPQAASQEAEAAAPPPPTDTDGEPELSGDDGVVDPLADPFDDGPTAALEDDELGDAFLAVADEGPESALEPGQDFDFGVTELGDGDVVADLDDVVFDSAGLDLSGGVDLEEPLGGEPGAELDAEGDSAAEDDESLVEPLGAFLARDVSTPESQERMDALMEDASTAEPDLDEDPEDGESIGEAFRALLSYEPREVDEPVEATPFETGFADDLDDGAPTAAELATPIASETELAMEPEAEFGTEPDAEFETEFASEPEAEFTEPAPRTDRDLPSWSWSPSDAGEEAEGEAVAEGVEGELSLADDPTDGALEGSALEASPSTEAVPVGDLAPDPHGSVEDGATVPISDLAPDLAPMDDGVGLDPSPDVDVVPVADLAPDVAVPVDGASESQAAYAVESEDEGEAAADAAPARDEDEPEPPIGSDDFQAWLERNSL